MYGMKKEGRKEEIRQKTGMKSLSTASPRGWDKTRLKELLDLGFEGLESAGEGRDASVGGLLVGTELLEDASSLVVELLVLPPQALKLLSGATPGAGRQSLPEGLDLEMLVLGGGVGVAQRLGEELDAALELLVVILGGLEPGLDVGQLVAEGLEIAAVATADVVERAFHVSDAVLEVQDAGVGVLELPERLLPGVALAVDVLLEVLDLAEVLLVLVPQLGDGGLRPRREGAFALGGVELALELGDL